MHIQGFMLDSARCLSNRAYYRRFIRFAAERGANAILWHFTDDQGCSLKLDCLPEAASPHAYSHDEMRELIAFAAGHGVMLIPELETLGHTRYITASAAHLAHLAENDEVFTSICPVHPQTRQILGDLIDEVAAVFDAPLIHAGLDEVNFGDHPLTREALQSRSRAELFADHVRFVRERIVSHGRRVMMWGDHLLRDPELAAATPKDVLVCDWQYRAEVPATTVQTLLSHGFDVVLCPAMISYDQPLFPGETFSTANQRSIARHRQLRGADAGAVVGSITTIWTSQRYLDESLWLAIDYAAAVMREGPMVEMTTQIRRFGASFYGLTPDEEWVEACRSVFQLSPMREDWLALQAGKAPEGVKGESLTKQAQRWSWIERIIADRAAEVIHERQAYETFLLMVRLVAAGWRRVVDLQIDGASSAVLTAYRELLQEVEQTWDRERFADDPRKWTPRFVFDRCNHLLVTMRDGIETIEQRQAAQAPVV